MPNQAIYKVTYNSKDITADISQCLISIDYVDEVDGQSDEFSITLDDAQGLWKYEWYPEKGSLLEAWITQDGNTLHCGIFQVDEVVAAGGRDSGDTIVIKALAAVIKEGVRTIKSYAHENKTLREIAATIADKYGFKIIGKVPSIVLGRQTQHRETDLHYLQRLSNEFGLQFSVRNKQMIFTSIFDLEGSAAVISFKKNQLTSYNLKDKTAETFLEATSAHFSPKSKKTILMKTTFGVVSKTVSTPKHDFLEIKIRTENAEQAELIAKTALYRANSLQQEGTLTLPGSPIVVSGINIELQELGMFSGIWHITKSHHQVSKTDGYITTPELKRVNVIAKEKMKQPDVF